MADGEVGKRTLTVSVRGGNYEFRIPSIHDDIRIGAKVKALYRAADPEYDGGSIQSLDFNAQYNLRLCATFEVLLLRASETWPWSEDKRKGDVPCDSSKWPPEVAGVAGEVFAAFSDALATFRKDANPGGQRIESKDLAGQPDPGGVAVP